MGRWDSTGYQSDLPRVVSSDPGSYCVSRAGLGIRKDPNLSDFVSGFVLGFPLIDPVSLENCEPSWQQIHSALRCLWIVIQTPSRHLTVGAFGGYFPVKRGQTAVLTVVDQCTWSLVHNWASAQNRVFLCIVSRQSLNLGFILLICGVIFNLYFIKFF